MKSSSAKASRIDRELADYEDLTALLLRRRELAQERLERASALFDRGLMVETQVNERRENIMGIERELIVARSTSANLRSERQSYMLQSQGRMARLAQDVLEARSSLSQLNRQLQQQRSASSFVLRSPIAGIATSLNCLVGERADQGTSIVTIIPKDANLYAEVFVDTAAIGFLEIGQSVQIRYDALPHEQHGSFRGVVREIASATVAGDEIATAYAIRGPVYRVAVNIETQRPIILGEPIGLRSGMQLSARIVLEEQSLISLFIDPLRNR